MCKIACQDFPVRKLTYVVKLECERECNVQSSVRVLTNDVSDSDQYFM